ncbi:MAG: hypothetical protein ABI855_16210 [Bacteroidota bacterium]
MARATAAVATISEEMVHVIATWATTSAAAATTPTAMATTSAEKTHATAAMATTSTAVAGTIAAMANATAAILPYKMKNKEALEGLIENINKLMQYIYRLLSTNLLCLYSIVIYKINSQNSLHRIFKGDLGHDPGT